MKPSLDPWLNVHRSKNLLRVSVFGTIVGRHVNELRDALQPGDKVELYIDSEGGDCQQAFEIVDLLDGTDSTAFIRNASSAAALIALACKRRMIHHDGSMMLHRPVAVIAGHIDELKAEMRRLGQLEAPMYRLIRRATGCGASAAFRWLSKDEDTWFTAQQALESGLVHEILPAPAFVKSNDVHVDEAPESAPKGPTQDETIALDLLKALGPLNVRDRAAFMREVGVLLTSNVHECK